MADASVTTERQRVWDDAAEKAIAAGQDAAAGLFTLLALPSETERLGHHCPSHAVGFSRDGRRGFKCGICGDVVKWVDPEPSA